MKCAVLQFSYAGFDHFESRLAAHGSYTSNLGDCAQTLAGIQAFERIGVDRAEIAFIDRDTLSGYSGPAAALLMNGVFSRHSLPAPPQIVPIFLGFNADAETIAAHADWLRRHAPIGCRDHATAALCAAHGIAAFTSGCVTFTLPRRTATPARPRMFVVQGWPGLLPSLSLREVPPALLATALFFSNRQVESQFPLAPERRAFNERCERVLLDRLATEATLVVTPLLHIAAPCVAMGVPVVVCRNAMDTRFDVLAEFLPIYLPDTLHRIDWGGGAPDVSALAARYLEALARSIRRVSAWQRPAGRF